MNYKLIAPRDKTLSITEQIFFNRGFSSKENILHYLNTDENDILDCSTIMNIKEGAKLLVSHISKNSKVMIQVDSDCDGFTSSAVLINYLNKIVPSFVQNNIYYRLHDSKAHGIILDTVPNDVKLVIAPDASSNEYDIHKELSEKGIDVLVIDHHNAEKISEYACVINNQLCDYPTKSLSGVGMVYKFCSYLDSLLNVDYANNYLDLVALGCLADMMDLRDYETKQLINMGLENVKNPYLYGMVQKNSYSLGGNLTPTGVSFYIAPYVNAICRTGTKEEKILLFESMLEFKAYELIPSTKRGCSGQKETRVEQACRTCANVKNRQTKSRDTSTEIIEKIIKDKDLLKNKILVVKLDKQHSIDKNLTGLIANQLMSKYQRPVLLLNQTFNEEKEMMWEGSGRGYEKSNLKNFQKFLKDSGFAEYAEGHNSAFGFGIKDKNFNDFILYCNETLKDYDFSPHYDVDFIFNPQLIQDYEILDIGKLEKYWGQGISEPYVVIENLQITDSNITLMKGSTLKITIPNTNISLIKFRSSEEEYETLHSKFGITYINVIGHCQINSFNGFENPQIKIEDYEISKKMDYYF